LSPPDGDNSRIERSWFDAMDEDVDFEVLAEDGSDVELGDAVDCDVEGCVGVDGIDEGGVGGGVGGEGGDPVGCPTVIKG